MGFKQPKEGLIP